MLRAARTAIALVLAVASFVVYAPSPAFATGPACAAGSFTVTRTSAPTLYLDLAASPAINSGYEADQITNNTASTVSDVWVRSESFGGAVFIQPATFATGLTHIGSMAPGATSNAFFSLTATATATTASPESHDISVYVAANDTTSGLGFQLAPEHRAPTWPDRAVLQQMHLDIMVESVADATPHVLGLGATRFDGESVFADPAGHPFCLVKRPGWAEPISD